MARNFAQDTTGAISVVFGVCAVALFLFVGAAVDFTRWYNARSQTAAAIDAAVLATARALQTSGGDQAEAKAVGEKYFEQASESRPANYEGLSETNASGQPKLK